MSQNIFNVDQSKIIIKTDILMSVLEKIKKIEADLWKKYTIKYENWSIIITFNEKYYWSNCGTLNSCLPHYNEDEVANDITKIFRHIKNIIWKDKFYNDIEVSSNFIFNSDSDSDGYPEFFIDINISSDIIILKRKKDPQDYITFLKVILENDYNKAECNHYISGFIKSKYKIEEINEI